MEQPKNTDTLFISHITQYLSDLLQLGTILNELPIISINIYIYIYPEPAVCVLRLCIELPSLGILESPWTNLYLSEWNIHCRCFYEKSFRWNGPTHKFHYEHDVCSSPHWLAGNRSHHLLFLFRETGRPLILWPHDQPCSTWDKTRAAKFVHFPKLNLFNRWLRQTKQCQMKQSAIYRLLINTF